MTVKSALWSKNVVLTLTGVTSNRLTSHIVESARYTGGTVDLLEVNDITDDTMFKDYIEGMQDEGEIELVLHGVELFNPGEKFFFTITVDSIPLITNKCGVVTEAGAVDVSGGNPTKTSLKFKVLPSSSRLLGGVTGPSGATGTGWGNPAA